MYYKDRLKSLEKIFGTKDIVIGPHSVKINDKLYPVIDDVIILSPVSKQSDFVKKKISAGRNFFGSAVPKNFAEDIQYSFGEEWQIYNEILPEHKKEFLQYFDIIDLDKLKGSCICDLGCGIGRWSFFLKDIAKELVLIDFSDAIFTARKNLFNAKNCLFFMCDLQELPFKDNFADFLFCIGVLHHLPTPALDEVCRLRRFAPKLLFYLYYSLDNRPLYFRFILKAATGARLVLCKIRNRAFRRAFSKIAALLLYGPLILLGRLLKPLRLSRYVPLYEIYHDKSIRRIEQDVYDRFFTGIEQRVSREEIVKLKGAFSDIVISENGPYWHFLCNR